MNVWVVNCRTETYDVYIGRPGPWGNPFTHLPTNGVRTIRVRTREESIRKFEEYVCGDLALVSRIKRELKGKVLGCYCAPLPCHGEVLARIANEEP